ncbi:MAG: PQQ-like beta-propeller repeat protein [Bacteroidales bacterium]|nr:PQQ-like beta-propeller repeat protein [Bacteroidales bacterium]
MRIFRSLYSQKLQTLVSLLLIFLFSQCKKEDSVSPVVNIIELSNTQISAQDTFLLKAKASDNIAIKEVFAYIINQNNQKVSKTYSWRFNQADVSIETEFILNDLYLESGSYFLVVEARDEFNTGKAYKALSISGIETLLKDIYIVEASNNLTKIYSIIETKKLIKELQQDYQDYVYNPYSKQNVFLSAIGVLTAYDSSFTEIIWQKTDLKSPSYTFYGSLLYKDKKVFVSDANGALIAFDDKGNVSWQGNTTDAKGQISEYVFWNDKIMLFKHPYSIGNDRIERMNATTGASVFTYTISFEPKQLLKVNDELCLVFGNEYNIAKACSLSTLYNVVHPFGNFDNRFFYDGYAITEYFYLLAFDDQIVEFDLESQYERVIDAVTAPIHFYFEPLSEMLYYTEGNKLNRSLYPNIGHIESFQQSATIDDLIFIYNK